MLTVPGILIVLALIFLVLSIAGRVPLWVAVLLVVLERLIAVVGVGMR